MPAAEVYFLQNALADAALLALAARWRGARAHPGRILLGAFFGALCAVVCAKAGGALLSVPVKIAVGALMLLIGVGPSCQGFLALWTGAALTGGAGRLGLPALAAGFGSGAALCALFLRKNAPPAPEAALVVESGGRTLRCSGLFDSGCRAVDPGTLLPVIILPAAPLPQKQTRALFVRTAAGSLQLACFTPDAVFINGKAVHASVAAAPEGALERALIPWALCAGRRKG